MYQRVVSLSLPKAQSIDIEFRDITYEARSGFRRPIIKQILKGVSGSIKSTQLTAIMGPSGAGKSTLLNILTGFQRDNWSGQIEYIGTNGKQTWEEYRKQSCYIQQDDNLHPLFTVEENMWMATNLKINSSLSQKAKEILIDDLLDNLDLSKTKETKCSKLSGGQKKRLSIALELVDNPPVMFLDEPTTGLDYLSSHQCIKLLQNLAKGGRTVVCTIHQPSAGIYEMFDTVFLLADGRCMYEGTPKNTIAYFASVGLQCPKYHNPADYMIDVVCKEYGNYTDQLIKMVENKEKPWRTDGASRNSKKEAPELGCANGIKTTVLVHAPSEFERFLVLVNRCAIQLFRDWTMTHLKLLLHLLVGILIGFMYTDSGKDGSKTISNMGYFMITAVYLCYTSMMPAILKFPSEVPTLKKERFNNWYQLRTYYAASMVCSFPIHVLFALVFSSVSYFLSSQPLVTERFLMFLSVSILTTLIADSMGLLIGTVVNPINGTFLGAISTCAMLALTGFLALYNHMPVFLYYMSYLSYLRYAVHGFVHTVYGLGREKLTCPKSYCHYRIPEVLMTDFSMAGGKYWVDIALLLCYYVFFRFATYFSLKKKLSSA